MSQKTFFDKMTSWRSIAGGWPARLLDLGVFMAALACFFLAGAVFVRGRPWAVIIYAENPYAHIAGGFGFLGLWHWLRHGYRDLPAWRRFVGRLILLSVSMTFSFFAGEVVMRMFLLARQKGNSLKDLQQLDRQPKENIRSTHPLGLIIQPSRWPLVVYELRPNLDTDFGGRPLRTNNSGFRDSKDYPLERIPDTVRIVGLGDSGMFGWNVDQDGNYLDVTEDILNRSGGLAVEIINMAVPGYNTQLEAETLQHKGLAYRPDVVIVGWCENDGHLPFFMLEKEDFTRRDTSFLHMYLCRRDDFREVAAGTTIKDLRTYNRDRVSSAMLEGTEAEGLRKEFTRLKAMCDERSIRLLVFGPLGDGIRDLLAELGITFYNTREKVDSSKYPEEWSVHFMHPSPDGHRVLGEHLAEFLQRNGYLQTSEQYSSSR